MKMLRTTRFFEMGTGTSDLSKLHEDALQCILDKMGAHFTLNCKDFDQKLPFYRIPIFSRTQNFAKDAK